MNEISGFFSQFGGFAGIILLLIVLEGILSIDNAAVLGAMVSVLSNDKAVPYPPALHFLQKWTDKYLGYQRSAALKVGLLGAYVGRALMLLVAAWISANPILRIIGAAYLVKIASEGLGHMSMHDDEEHDPIKKPKGSFWLVVLNVELADLAFSLDNVVAAVALSKELWVVMIGVGLGILTMRFAAGAFTWMIEREPIFSVAAYIVVLNIGAELIWSEFSGHEVEHWQKFLISLGTFGLCYVYARAKFLHPTLGPLFRAIGKGLGLLNRGVNLLFVPLLYPFKAVYRLMRPATAEQV